MFGLNFLLVWTRVYDVLTGLLHLMAARNLSTRFARLVSVVEKMKKKNFSLNFFKFSFYLNNIVWFFLVIHSSSMWLQPSPELNFITMFCHDVPKARTSLDLFIFFLFFFPWSKPWLGLQQWIYLCCLETKIISFQFQSLESPFCSGWSSQHTAFCLVWSPQDKLYLV